MLEATLSTTVCFMQYVSYIYIAGSNEKHAFNELFKRLDVLNRCHLYLWACNRWLNIRMSVSVCALLPLYL